MVTELLEKYQQMRGSQQTVRTQLTSATDDTLRLQARYAGAVKAVAMVQEASSRTQKRLEYHISHVVTLALQAVFTEAYEFRMKFEKRRKGTECDLWLLKNGKQCDPLLQSGGGVCDIISFALNVALLSIAIERNGVRAVLILDEPFGKLHGREKQKRTSEIVKLLSQEYGLQIIMVSDVETINHAADQIFRFSLDANGQTLSN